MTDGNDTNSQTYKSVSSVMADIGRTSEQKTDVSIFTIGYGKDADVGVLGTIAQGAGGDYRKAASSSDIQAVYRDLSTFF